jgi:L-ascorbate metabolism protein UlaG (beta-lactamase superfamily)
MDNVRRAKDRLAPLDQVSITHSHGGHVVDSEETDRRNIKQRQEFEVLYRQYQLKLKAKEKKKMDENANVEKPQQRESRFQAIREKKF